MALQFNVLTEEDDDRPMVKLLHDILVQYAQANDTTAADVAHQIDSLTPIKRQKSPEDEVESTYAFLLRFWETLVAIVQQVPFDHACQDKIVKLIQELQTGPASPVQASVSSQSIWVGLEGLDETLQELWNEPSKSRDGPESLDYWINLNSFAARLFGLSLIESAERFPIWTMRSSLEEEGEVEHEINEMRMLAASQWAQFSGPALFTIMTSQTVDQNQARAYSSSKFKGQDVCSRARWNFWKQAFKQRSQDLPLSDRAQAAVRRSVQAMEMAEETNAGK